MKLYIKSFLIVMSVLSIACSDSNDEHVFAKPEINNLIIGHDNSHQASLSSDLHIEADIIADARIEKIILIIHPEGEHHDHTSMKSEHDEWEIELEFLEFKGLKNTIFHKHIDVPANADLGDYHFHIAVVDAKGNKTELNEEFVVVAINK